MVTHLTSLSSLFPCFLMLASCHVPSLVPLASHHTLLTCISYKEILKSRKFFSTKLILIFMFIYIHFGNPSSVANVNGARCLMYIFEGVFLFHLLPRWKLQIPLHLYWWLWYCLMCFWVVLCKFLECWWHICRFQDHFCGNELIITDWQ